MSKPETADSILNTLVIEQRIEALPESERGEALEILSAIVELRERNPLEFYNLPGLPWLPQHHKQIAFHSMQDKVKCFFGGNQSGKTTAGLADDLIQALSRDDLPDHLLEFKKFEPPFHCRILAPSIQVLELTIFEKLKDLIPPHTLMGGSWRKAYDKMLRILRFENGSTFQFMTYIQDVAMQGGVTIHRVHYDEEPPRAHRHENRLRVMRYGGDEVFTMTPLQGLSWMYKEMWMKRGEEVSTHVWKNNAEKLGTVLVDMDDNPYLTQQNKEDALRGLSEEEMLARKSGQFVHFAGLIYADFNPNHHILSNDKWMNADGEIEYPQNKNVIVAIDPGYRYAMAALYCMILPDQTMYVIDELYEKNMNIKDFSMLMHHTNMLHQVTPLYYVIDPAARNKISQTGRSDQMEFADHGIYTIPGQNKVDTGIGRVRLMLQENKLYIMENCRNLIEEFQEYRWKEAPRNEEDGKPIPMKTNDHALDALRYAVMSRPYAPTELIGNNETQLEKAMRLDRERAAQPANTSSEFGGVYY